MIMGFTQMAGVASVMPFMSLAANPAAIEANSFLAAGYTILGFSDVQQYLLFCGFVVLAALLIAIATKALTTYAMTRFIEMRSYALSRKLLAAYLRQPYEWFLNRHSADLGKTILSESEQVIVGTLHPALYLISEGVVILTLAVLLVIVDPALTVAVIVVFAASYTVIYVFLRNYLDRIGAERLSSNRGRFRIIQETFASIKDVKVGGLEGDLLKGFDSHGRKFVMTRATEVVANQMPRFAIEALAFGGLLGVVLYLLAKPGGLQHALPILAAYAFAAYRLMPALQNFYAMLVSLRLSGPALEALSHELIELAPAPEVSDNFPSERARPLGLSRCLALERLTYAYPGSDHRAIDALSLEIPANTTVGLVGKTGSGKTTAVDVILGLLRPQQGCVRVDGTSINSDNLRAWQATIGYVPQHIYFTDASVTANIAFNVAPEQVNHKYVERAARIANIHDFVTQELPRGYETTVGERGVRLSGGQRQRIGIARALYHDPDLLILDEATSALDNLTEKAVMEAVHNLGKRKTVIIIAHRLTTVRECDMIVLLANGSIAAQGQFDELADREVSFRAMIMAAST
jgi:ABC-type multidrug transport system fused ATPase/permease subunit